MDHKSIISLLVERYNRCQVHQYQVTCWPDEENSRSRDIDAYAEAPGAVPLAIEHTRVETFFGQFQDNARFADYYGQLEDELKDAFDFHLMLSLPVFAFQKGTKWAGIRDTVRAWLLANASTFPERESSHQINNVPFSVGISKDKRLGNRFVVARRAPSDQDIQIELVLNFAESLSDKNDQLSRYRTAGAHTILILESQDIALVSAVSLYKAYLQAQRSISIPNLDEVWLACTFAPQSVCNLYCLSGPEEIMDCINPENFQWGPRYSKEWDEAIKEDQAKISSIDIANYVPMQRR